MPSCPGCSYPIHISQILCGRCISSDLAVRWPACQQCQWYEVCHQSGYQLCIHCDVQKRAKQHDAALLIQRFVRDYFMRHYAATVIQALWRGHSSRRGFVPPEPLRWPGAADEPLCSACHDDIATLFNDYGDGGDVCADCFWDLRDKYRREAYLKHVASLEKLIH